MQLHKCDCYKRIAFSLNDSDGTLRFKKFKVNEIDLCNNALLKLEEYLQSIPLVDIDMDKVYKITENCHQECRNQIRLTIIEQKKLFTHRKIS